MAKTVSEGILRGIEAYSKARQARQGDLGDQLKMFETMRKLQAYNEPVPKGFVRIGDEIKSDPSFLNQVQQLQVQKTMEADEQKKKNIIEDAKSQYQAIQKAKLGVKNRYFGPLGNFPSIPIVTGDYSKRSEWEANINKLLASKVLETMNALKSASRTGSTGFGALNKEELQTLRDASTSLTRKLDPEIAGQYLNDMESIYRKVLGTEVPSASVPGSTEQSKSYASLWS